MKTLKFITWKGKPMARNSVVCQRYESRRKLSLFERFSRKYSDCSQDINLFSPQVGVSFNLSLFSSLSLELLQKTSLAWMWKVNNKALKLTVLHEINLMKLKLKFADSSQWTRPAASSVIRHISGIIVLLLRRLPHMWEMLLSDKVFLLKEACFIDYISLLVGSQ